MIARSIQLIDGAHSTEEGTALRITHAAVLVHARIASRYSQSVHWFYTHGRFIFAHTLVQICHKTPTILAGDNITQLRVAYIYTGSRMEFLPAQDQQRLRALFLGGNVNSRESLSEVL